MHAYTTTSTHNLYGYEMESIHKSSATAVFILDNIWRMTSRLLCTNVHDLSTVAFPLINRSQFSRGSRRDHNYALNFAMQQMSFLARLF